MNQSEEAEIAYELYADARANGTEAHTLSFDQRAAQHEARYQRGLYSDVAAIAYGMRAKAQMWSDAAVWKSGSARAMHKDFADFYLRVADILEPPDLVREMFL